ncbi:hypothetical protein V5O48_011335, partial [Marasmius crinis-equi]
MGYGGVLTRIWDLLPLVSKGFVFFRIDTSLPPASKHSHRIPSDLEAIGNATIAAGFRVQYIKKQRRGLPAPINLSLSVVPPSTAASATLPPTRPIPTPSSTPPPANPTTSTSTTESPDPAQAFRAIEYRVANHRNVSTKIERTAFSPQQEEKLKALANGLGMELMA